MTQGAPSRVLLHGPHLFRTSWGASAIYSERLRDQRPARRALLDVMGEARTRVLSSSDPKPGAVLGVGSKEDGPRRRCKARRKLVDSPWNEHGSEWHHIRDGLL